MILTGPEIRRQIELGNIEIDPFDPARLNPNSYNLRLGNKVATYRPGILSTRTPPEIERVFEIPPGGYVLKQGKGYLASTVERVLANGFAPTIDGRSSTGRLFLVVHVTAGYGDDAFDGEWTLEIVPLTQDVRVYANDELLQVRFHALMGERMPYAGRYQGQQGPVGSKGV